MSQDSGALEYNKFKEKKISSNIIVKLTEEEQNEMRKNNRNENKGKYTGKGT